MLAPTPSPSANGNPEEEDSNGRTAFPDSAIRPVRATASSSAEESIDNCLKAYNEVRQRTMAIVAPLEVEDYVVQTAPFMSPPRWHMGHTTWFFEMLLKEYQPGYQVYCEDYLYYFNSYYQKFGGRIDKAMRGTKSRPTVKETVQYRSLIDQRMAALFWTLQGAPKAAEALSLVRLGIEHEMQHQELLVYDIKHLLADLYVPLTLATPARGSTVEGMSEIEGGLFTMGHAGEGFAYDNEKPAHLVYLHDYAIDRAPVTNGQYLEFVRDGGYEDHRWWLSEGWNAVSGEGWRAPLYWERDGANWLIRDLSGLHPVEEKSNEPVSHVSYFEAAAFAKWSGKRLPTEAEWEKAATFDPKTHVRSDFPWGSRLPSTSVGNLFENNLWAVAPVGAFPAGQSPYGCHQMIGDVWEWTSSDYAPYPGFKSDFDEYNDKFFVGQKVLRGGSFATPQSHIRSTYRNFFGPQERWVISGIRLAKSL
jgi:ergothioneine biosynthesis protein EgtB